MISIDALFIRWIWARAVLHRGWWLATSLYLVTVAGLTPSQLVFIGVAQGIISLICEVPAGVVADTFSRKWSLVISHVLMGTAMLTAGLVTDFAAIVATQMLWGLSWTFASGSDVAWVTDELNQSQKIARVLTKSAHAQLFGSAVGIISLGVVAWITNLSVAMVSAGAAMLLLGVFVALRFPETQFKRIRSQRWLASWEIFKEGISLVRYSRTILLVFAATFLVNGVTDAYGRLFPKQLLTIGLPGHFEPIIWLTGLSIASLVVGAFALRIVEARVHGADVAQRDYIFAALAGVAGLMLLALAPNAALGIVGILLVSGLVEPITRILATIMVNSRTTNKVRATVHSFLAQAEYLGEIICGTAIGLTAYVASLPLALTGCAVVLAAAALVMTRRPKERVIQQSNTPPLLTK